jgi:hypothetical protein
LFQFRTAALAAPAVKPPTMAAMLRARTFFLMYELQLKVESATTKIDYAG